MDGTSMTVAGTLRPASQVLVAHQTRGDTQGPVLLSGLPETSSPEMWTFAPWNVGAARTVNLAETPAIKRSSKPDIRVMGPISVGEVVGVLVCITVLLVLAAVIAIFLARMRRRRKTGQQTTPHDEEEGLIEMVATATEEEGQTVGEDEETDSMGRRPRGVRRLKTPPSRNGIHDEENEETPMLSNMEETSLSRPPCEKNMDFMQMIENLPMIDADDEEGDQSGVRKSSTSSPITEIATVQCTEDSGSTSQLEWDHQVELKLVQPLMEDLLVASSSSGTFESCRSSMYSSGSESSFWWDSNGYVTPPLTYCEPVSTVVAENPDLEEGEVWTESQVLAMLVEDETTDMMWDSNEDLFVDTTENPATESQRKTPCTTQHVTQSPDDTSSSSSTLHHPTTTCSGTSMTTSPTPADRSPASHGKQELILGLHVHGEHLGPFSNTSPPITRSDISRNCLKRVTSHLSPTATTVESTFVDSDYDQEDIPRVSSQIDLSQTLPAAVTAQPSGRHTAHASVVDAGRVWSTGEHGDSSEGVRSCQHEAGGECSDLHTEDAVQTACESIGGPLSENEAILASPSMIGGIAAAALSYVEPNVIVHQCGPESEEDEENLPLSPMESTSLETPPTQQLQPTGESSPTLVTTQQNYTHGTPPPACISTNTSPTTTSDSDWDNDAIKLSPSRLVLPAGTQPIQVPDGVSPGLPLRRNIKLKRPRKKTK